MQETQEKAKILQSLLFIENKVVERKIIEDLLKISEEELSGLVEKINESYVHAGAPFCMYEVEGGYELTVEREFAAHKLHELVTRKKKMPKSILETLAIIAYKQPITRSEIEKIRGVGSINHIKKVQEEGFVEEAGRKDSVGNPVLYKTTEHFLKYFNLKSLSELPSVGEIKNFDFLNESY